ncbi:MAG: hypothetical protein WAX77_03720 [Methylococcaceae bacterium]
MLYFEKSQPAPECLTIEKQKANGDYKCGCVIERLQTDFANKCYICEDNQATSINVEHFKAHRGNKDLEFDWHNLFFACGHCNNIKLASFEPLLNCTDYNDFETDLLRYLFNPLPFENVIIETLSQENKVINTRELLMAVFNGTTKLKKLESASLRKKLLKEVRKFQDCLIEYYESEEQSNKDYYKMQLIKHLHKTSAFTSFKRQIIKDNPSYREFIDLCIIK